MNPEPFKSPLNKMLRWFTLISNRQQQRKQLRHWQTASLPVYVALHLFASSLGYFSRRRHV